jgi:hypothetical protein
MRNIKHDKKVASNIIFPKTNILKLFYSCIFNEIERSNVLELQN